MKRYKGYIILFIVVLLLTGCKSEKEKDGKIEKKDKAPSSLSDFSQGLQEILNDVEKIEKIIDGTDIEMNEEKVKEEDSKDKSNDEKGKEKEDEGKDQKEDQEKDKEKDEEKEKANKLLERWTNIDKKIEDVHKKWDSYGLEGKEKGISSEIRERLEEKLNSLTKAIGERDITNIYEYGSQTMLGLEPIFNLYKDEIKGSTNKIKYYTYQSYLNVMEGRKTRGQNLLENLTGDLNQIRVKLEKDEEKIKILDKLNLSIETMKAALGEDSINLYRIKKDIIIKNINELEK